MLKMAFVMKKGRALFQVLPLVLPDIDDLYGPSRVHSQEDIEEFLPGDDGYTFIYSDGDHDFSSL